MGYRRSSKYYRSTQVWHELFLEVIRQYGLLRGKKKKNMNFPGVKNICSTGTKSADLQNQLISRDLIWINSNLAKRVSHQLPPDVWQEQAGTLTSFLFQAVTDKACVLSRNGEGMLWAWAHLNEISFFFLTYLSLLVNKFKQHFFVLYSLLQWLIIKSCHV